jgi:hypothetical protein
LSRYWLGQPVRLSSTVRQLNVDGTTTLVNATTATYVVKIANADGTSTTTGTYSSPANDGTGLYHQDVPAADLTLTGHYQWTFTTTGPGAGVQVGDFDVADPFETAVLPLADAKDMLNIAQAVTAYDAELQSWIATIETSLEALTGGPLVNRACTERGELDGTCTILQVQQRPVVSVTSITPVATGVPADLTPGLDIDPGAGIIRSKLGYRFGLSWDAGVTVIYVAGWGTAIPAAFNAAARIILANLWDTQHGPSVRPSMGGTELTALPPFPYMIPRGAAELLNGQLGGIPFRCPVFA